MGILSSAMYCMCLLGSQFSFTAGLWSLSKGEDKQDAGFFRSRGIIYSTVVFLTGLWLLIGGGLESLFFCLPLNIFLQRSFFLASSWTRQCRSADALCCLARFSFFFRFLFSFLICVFVRTFRGHWLSLHGNWRFRNHHWTLSCGCFSDAHSCCSAHSELLVASLCHGLVPGLWKCFPFFCCLNWS